MWILFVGGRKLLKGLSRGRMWLDIFYVNIFFVVRDGEEVVIEFRWVMVREVVVWICMIRVVFSF